MLALQGGTVNFMAPEHIKAIWCDHYGSTDRLTVKADIWSFACTTIEMTGMVFFAHHSTLIAGHSVAWHHIALALALIPTLTLAPHYTHPRTRSRTRSRSRTYTHTAPHHTTQHHTHTLQHITAQNSSAVQCYDRCVSMGEH